MLLSTRKLAGANIMPPMLVKLAADVLAGPL